MTEKYIHPLRLAREKHNLTQERLAEKTGVSVKTIWNAEHDKPISAESRRILCRFLKMNAQELGLISAEDRTKKESNKLEIAVIEMSHQPTELLFTGSGHITTIIDYAESIINLAWEAWFASQPIKAAWEINKLLPQLQQLLHTPLPKHHLLRVHELTMRSHGLLGAINVDALKNDTALYHYTLAHQLAAEDHNIDQSTTYLALMGDTLRRQGEKLKAISYMQNAHEMAYNARPATQGHILQLLAYTYADTGNEPDFERCIAEADNLLAFSQESTDTAKKEFVPFEVYEIRGKASRDLGKPVNALRYLTLAEAALDQMAVPQRWYAVLDISKGQAYCDMGDLTNGITLASQGFIQAYRCRSPRQMNRVRKLLRKLESGTWKNEQRVADLKELLHETYLRMDPEE